MFVCETKISLLQASTSAARRRTPQPLARNDSLSALRLTPTVNSSPLQPLHTRLQIDIEVDQRTGSARIDSWSPVSCDSSPLGSGYSTYGQLLQLTLSRLSVWKVFDIVNHLQGGPKKRTIFKVYDSCIWWGRKAIYISKRWALYQE